MTIDEAIKRAEKAMNDFLVGYDSEVEDLEKYAEARDMVLSALRAQRMENEPLTIEQMMRMIGDPVYVVSEGRREWCIVHSYNRPEVIGKCMILTARTATKRYLQIDEYGKTWTAYRQPPKEGD